MSKNNNFISIDNAKIENDIKKRNLIKEIKIYNKDIIFFKKDVKEIIRELKNKNLTDKDIQEIVKKIKEIKIKDEILQHNASLFMTLSEINDDDDLRKEFRDVENEKQFEEAKQKYDKKYFMSESSTNSDVSDITTISRGGNPKKSKKRRRTQKKNKTIFKKQDKHYLLLPI